MTTNERTIRAQYDDETITVYQAYNHQIADSAVSAQNFVSPPFKKERMTWIKPSFLWMMYRSGWAGKENQERVLSIKIKRSGFEWALENSCLSHFEKQFGSYEKWQQDILKLPVRIQWDPERDLFLQPLAYRSIQIGLSNIAVEKYLSEWIVQIDDISDISKQISTLVNAGKINQAKDLLPVELIYPLPETISKRIGVYNNPL